MNAQMDRLKKMAEVGGWYTLHDVADSIGASESGASARLRQLRSEGWNRSR